MYWRGLVCARARETERGFVFAHSPNGSGGNDGMRAMFGHALYWLGFVLALVWGLFFIGEGVEDLMRGELDVAALALIGAALIWGLGYGARWAIAGR
jgi:hypothetical protein